MGAKGMPKTGGRLKGTPNRTTSARFAAMARVNDALIEVGKDPLTGMRLLKDVLNHRETPLDIRIQCAQILVKEENAPAEEQKYLTIMPPPMPAESTEAQQ